MFRISHLCVCMWNITGECMEYHSCLYGISQLSVWNITVVYMEYHSWAYGISQLCIWNITVVCGMLQLRVWNIIVVHVEYHHWECGVSQLCVWNVTVVCVENHSCMYGISQLGHSTVTVVSFGSNLWVNSYFYL